MALNLKVSVTPAVLAECARAVWATEHPAMLWPSACDDERAKCARRAMGVINALKSVQKRRKK